jgi:phage shock protein C
MLCSSCSGSFDGTAKFCSNCGLPLQQPTRMHEPLQRLRAGRMIAGVCAGFAQAYNMDVTLVRLVLCIAAFCSAGTVLFAYIILWIIMPAAPYTLPPQTVSVTAS